MKKKIKQFIYNTLAIFNILLIIIYKILVLPRTISDFSKLKVVYMVVDETLYSEPTKEKYLELGYPKELLSSVDKIQSFFGLFQEYKNNKIKKKVK